VFVVLRSVEVTRHSGQPVGCLRRFYARLRLRHPATGLGAPRCPILCSCREFTKQMIPAPAVSASCGTKFETILTPTKITCNLHFSYLRLLGSEGDRRGCVSLLTPCAVTLPTDACELRVPTFMLLMLDDTLTSLRPPPCVYKSSLRTMLMSVSLPSALQV
jgi:hypothetical protein